MTASLAEAVPPLESTNTLDKPRYGSVDPAGVGSVGALNPAAVETNLEGSNILLLMGSLSVYLSLKVSSSKTRPSEAGPATI